MITVMRQQALVVVICFFVVSVSAASSSSEDDNKNDPSNAVRLELIHRHSPHHEHILGNAEIGWRPKSRLEQVEEMIRSDEIRHLFISSQRMASSSRRMAQETANDNSTNSQNGTSSTSKLKIFSGADDLLAMYLVTIKVGTPTKDFLVAVDTGSDLTWVRCKYRGGKKSSSDLARRRRQAANYRKVFIPRKSSSFQKIACSSQLCINDLAEKGTLNICLAPSSPCWYMYSYQDQSYSMGMFGKETISLPLSNGRKARVREVLIGCSKVYRGVESGGANGILGLGYNDNSFMARVEKQLGGKFSYCLVDHRSHKNVGNYLTFGETLNKTTTHAMQFTQLYIIGSHYVVNMVGISVNDALLPIPNSFWEISAGTSGAMIDSGSSLSYLIEPAYSLLMDAMVPSLAERYKRVEGMERLARMEYCFRAAGFNETFVPRLAYHFQGGAKFQPPVKSYIIDVDEGIMCLGFGSMDTFVIGNVMQQNHLWEFDITGRKLGFAPSLCI